MGISTEAVQQLPSTGAEGPCFHCGLPVPEGSNYSAEINGIDRSMCCPGCEAVAQAIVAGGLNDYYKFRDTQNATGRELVPHFLDELKLYDNPKVQQSFVRHEEGEGDDVREASLIIEGIVCAACVWLNEHHIASMSGVLDMQINYSTHRARLRWDNSIVSLSDVLAAISRIGYLAHPYDPGRQQLLFEKQRKQSLRRLGLAGIFGMQVMMLAVALYFGQRSGMDAGIKNFFQWLSLLLTLPVLLYSAQPFFLGAWRDIKNLRMGMDVPVTLGIAAAFIASVIHSITGSGEIYFDSVVMFVFFLLVARHFEMAGRKRAAESSEALVRQMPAMATRLVNDREEVIPAVELGTGDHLLIRPGEHIPADGIVTKGRSSIDESLLTGESLPVSRSTGEQVIGGSINIESPFTMEVLHSGEDTRLSGILRLLDKAQAEKPRISLQADRIVSFFVGGVLLLATIVGIYWWVHEPAQWLAITIAVLVVTCPCALSLATPTAMTAATGNLTTLGLLTTRGHALETLVQATHVIFDKTGTLTRGILTLKDIRTYTDRTPDECLAMAAALENFSEHPLARAIIQYAGDIQPPVVSEVSNVPGSGLSGKLVSGKLDGDTLYIGSPKYILASTQHSLDGHELAHLGENGDTVVILASRQALLAAFILGDECRDDAAGVVASLQQAGKQVMLLTGDHPQAAQFVARQCGIEQVMSELSPQDKLQQVKRLQQQGAVVAMVGDGVNDAPVMAQAQVSIAMGGGTQLALTSGDMILLSEQLGHLPAGLEVARRTLSIIRQNLLWAIGYNVIALPVAAMGLLQPWMAALGMSFSSLFVVMNALRLTRMPARIPNRGPAQGGH
ncbi:MAG: heavy metal translocating P-type ATPase [Gammaproteobacteria bacterium]|nr:MAG: heavy metal translocating P-type ATPase [Gammaproteobacteria bacterium]